uniref:Uncharacterized protein n=1 Tax=Anopheles dirus TaxID=7168 RepID=A0A182NNZ2_9DIPT
MFIEGGHTQNVNNVTNTAITTPLPENEMESLTTDTSEFTITPKSTTLNTTESTHGKKFFDEISTNEMIAQSTISVPTTTAYTIDTESQDSMTTFEKSMTHNPLDMNIMTPITLPISTTASASVTTQSPTNHSILTSIVSTKSPISHSTTDTIDRSTVHDELSITTDSIDRSITREDQSTRVTEPDTTVYPDRRTTAQRTETTLSVTTIGSIDQSTCILMNEQQNTAQKRHYRTPHLDQSIGQLYVMINLLEWLNQIRLLHILINEQLNSERKRHYRSPHLAQSIGQLYVMINLFE